MNRRALTVVVLLERVQRHLTTARMVGKIAVQIGSQEVGKALRHVMTAVNDSKVVPGTVSNDSDIQLALANYPLLSAIEIITQLESLSDDELRALAEFENSHRKRRTVLFKIDQLLSTNRANHS